jgi:transposase
MSKGLTVTKREEHRANVLAGIEAKQLTIEEAGTLLHLSERQVWRLLGMYRTYGLRGLVHGNRQRVPKHRIADALRQQVTQRALGAYDGANHCHLTELLKERDGICLSRSTVRRILREAGLGSPRHRRSPKHRSRRERYAQEGMLLQIDGSPHPWLEDRGPRLTLVAAIDDATGRIAAAVFRVQEDTQGYFLLLQQVFHRHGVPLALYSDRHSIFHGDQRARETIEEQLAGERRLSQFGEALKVLGIQLILAHSPQAKGRIERLWETLQSRLVIELRLAGVTNAEEANRFLAAYLPRFNQEFAVPPAAAGSAYRPLDPTVDLAAVLCFKYYRTAAPDNTVSFDGETFQLLPGPDRRSYARHRVEVQERLDGSVVIWSQGQQLGSRPAPPNPVTLRARSADRGREPRLAAKAQKAPGNLGSRMSPADVSPGEPARVESSGRAQGRGEAGSGPAAEARHVDVAKSQPTKPSPNHPWRTYGRH